MVTHTPINEDICANIDEVEGFHKFHTPCIPTSYFFNAGDGDVQQDRPDLAADDDQVDAGGEGTQERNRNAG